MRETQVVRDLVRLAVEFGLHPGVSGRVKQESGMIGFIFREDGFGFLGGRGKGRAESSKSCHIASQRWN